MHSTLEVPGRHSLENRRPATVLCLLASTGLLSGSLATTENGVAMQCFHWYPPLSELDEIQGFVAAVANHTDNSVLRRNLNALFQKLREYEDLYEDELSPGAK